MTVEKLRRFANLYIETYEPLEDPTGEESPDILMAAIAALTPERSDTMPTEPCVMWWKARKNAKKWYAVTVDWSDDDGDDCLGFFVEAGGDDWRIVIDGGQWSGPITPPKATPPGGE